VDRQASRESVRRSLEQLLRVSASRRGFAARMAAVGVHLSQPAAAVLGHVCDAAPLAMGDLARATRNDPGATARQVAALEADGLVVRERSDSDGRVNLVRATDEGRRMAARVADAQTRHLDHALRGLADGELAATAAHLERLVGCLTTTDVLRDGAEDPPA
jgi:DNA-binding MarR family transcriptional regulator